MSHIEGLSRKQALLLPPNIEDWIPPDHPARVVDLFVESVDPTKLGMREGQETMGRPSYSPKVMLKVLLYGYATGERSSRKLERLTYENLAYIWLTGNLHPDYRTIARFRQNNLEAMKGVLKETLQLFVRVKVKFDGVVFVDGTKLYANASNAHVATADRLKQLEAQVEKMLQEAQAVDGQEDQESGDQTPHKISTEALARLQAEVERSREALERSEGKRVSLTDADAPFMPHAQGHGLHLSYNGQLSASTDGIILEADVAPTPADGTLLKARVNGVEENTGKKVKTVVADAGYHSTKALYDLSKDGTQAIVPSAADAGKIRHGQARYGREHFTYDPKTDQFQCPAGKVLRFYREKRDKGMVYREYAGRAGDCRTCPHREDCFQGQGKQRGRKVRMLKDQAWAKAHQRVMTSSKGLMKQRRCIIEPVIGILKSQFGFRRFLLRGLNKVKAEWRLLAAAYNLMKYWRRMVARA